MMFQRILSTNLLVALLSTGCSGSADTLATTPLTGEVKRMTGEPIGNITIVFYPSKGPSTATKTDAAGKFTANLPIGDCKAAVVEQSEATSTDTSPEATQAPPAGKSKIKPTFASPESSGLTVRVQQPQKDKVVFVVD